MRKEKNGEKGLLSLEACIFVTIFLFLMLFLYSFFVVFETRNAIGHVVLATANSMSMDAYQNTTMSDSDTIMEILYRLYGYTTNDNSTFTDYREWYSFSEAEEGEEATLSADFPQVLEDRFVAFLTNGHPEDAEEILERYNIVGGLNGLDFSQSTVKDGKLYVSVSYTMEYEFKVFDVGEVEMTQSACSKIWE